MEFAGSEQIVIQYDERAKLKKEARSIDTLKANVDDFIKPSAERDRDQQHSSQRE